MGLPHLIRKCPVPGVGLGHAYIGGFGGSAHVASPRSGSEACTNWGKEVWEVGLSHWPCKCPVPGVGLWHAYIGREVHTCPVPGVGLGRAHIKGSGGKAHTCPVPGVGLGHAHMGRDE